ncbi:MAG: hypothetical protein ACOCWO_01195 [Candidatus Muiribacteriaceae bacterium]
MKARSLFLINMIFILCVNVFPHGATFAIRKSPPAYSPGAGYEYVYDFVTNEYISVEFERVFTGKHCETYVEVGSATGDEDLIQEISEEFDTNIYRVVTEAFGEPPMKRIRLMFTDVRDFYNHGSQNYYGGYFDPDLGESADSIFIDTYPSFVYADKEEICGVVAHEFQHLIHHHYDRHEEKWLNEGMSELATYIYGVENDIHVENYISFPYISLSEWNNTISDYGKVYLFFRYLVYRNGLPVLKKIIRNTQTGMNSLAEVLGYDELRELFTDWAAALCLNSDENIRFDIMGLDFELEPVNVGKGDYFAADYNMEPYTFYKLDWHPGTKSTFPVMLTEESDERLNIYAGFYSEGKLKDVVLLEQGEPYIPDFHIEKAVICAVNPGRKPLKAHVGLKRITPEYKVLPNPGYIDNRLFAFKGVEVTGIKLNDRKIPSFTHGKARIFSADINIFGSNTISCDFRYENTFYTGSFYFRSGEL